MPDHPVSEPIRLVRGVKLLKGIEDDREKERERQRERTSSWQIDVIGDGYKAVGRV